MFPVLIKMFLIMFLGSPPTAPYLESLCHVPSFISLLMRLPSLEDSRTWSQFDQAPSVSLCLVWALDHAHGFTIILMSPYHWTVLDCILPSFLETSNAPPLLCVWGGSRSHSLFHWILKCHIHLSMSSRPRSQYYPPFTFCRWCILFLFSPPRGHAQCIFL